MERRQCCLCFFLGYLEFAYGANVINGICDTQSNKQFCRTKVSAFRAVTVVHRSHDSLQCSCTFRSDIQLKFCGSVNATRLLPTAIKKDLLPTCLARASDQFV
jgi:hypothetical protein